MLLGLGDAGGSNRHVPKSQGLNNHKSSCLTHVKSCGSAGHSAFQWFGSRFSSPCTVNISTRDVKFMMSGEEIDGEGTQTVKNIGPEVPYHFCSHSHPPELSHITPTYQKRHWKMWKSTWIFSEHWLSLCKLMMRSGAKSPTEELFLLSVFGRGDQKPSFFIFGFFKLFIFFSKKWF